MLRNRRIQVGCLVAASALTLFSVRPSLVVADADNVAPALSIDVPIGGESRTTVQFTVPAIVPTELAALVDTTGSGSADLAPVGLTLVGAADAIAQTNPSLRVGLATSGELPVFPFGLSTDIPYQLKAPMSAVRTEWATALQGLQAVEGGGDVKEGQLVALRELLKSTSEDPTRRPVGFDPTARRVVVVSTDSAPHLDTDSWCNGATCLPYPGPSLVDTQSMLDQVGITLIVLGRGDVGALRSIAYATGGTVVDVSSPDRMAGLTNAIQVAPITVRPVLTGCEGLSVKSDQLTVRARPGETASVPVVITAAAGLVEGPRSCSLEFAGVHQAVTINAAVPCGSDGSTTSTTPSSTVPSPTSTSTPEGSTTTTEPATTTSAAPSTTTSAAPSTTTTAVPETTTTQAQPTTTALVPPVPSAPLPTGSDPTTTTSPSANSGSTPTTLGSAAGPSTPLAPGQCLPVTTVPASTTTVVSVPLTTVPASTTTVVSVPVSTVVASTTTVVSVPVSTVVASTTTVVSVPVPTVVASTTTIGPPPTSAP